MSSFNNSEENSPFLPSRFSKLNDSLPFSLGMPKHVHRPYTLGLVPVFQH